MSTFALFVAMLAPAIFVARGARPNTAPATGRAEPRRPPARRRRPASGERGRGSNREYRSVQDGDHPA